MADSSLLSIGRSGVQAFQRSLNTIGHNIANVNTEGYSKQSVDLATRIPQINGYGFAGSGVQTTSVTRSYDAFIEVSLRSSTSSASEFEAFHALATQLDNVLADSNTGMSASIQSFFNAVQDVADAPSDITVREVMLNAGKNLSDQFNELSAWMETVRDQTNGNIRNNVADINSLSNSIAKLNESIVLQQGKSGGQPANDLLDQRDTLIRDLSELVSISTIQQDDGSVNVMAGSGQTLVVGNKATTLEVYVVANDPGQLGIAIKGSGGTLVPVTEQMSGGKLGGVIGFRDRMLDSASNSLGLVAIGLSQYVNEQQNQGMDLENNLGRDFFSTGTPATLTVNGSPGIVNVSFNDVSQMTNKDYTMRFNSGAWQLTQNDTNQVVAMTGTGTAVNPFIADGLRIEITAAPANGDIYLIRPTRSGAVDMNMELTDGRQIAAAAPVRSLSVNSNTGTGAISAGVITDINNPVFQSSAGQLSPPVLARFTTSNSYDIYDNTNPASPVLLEAGIIYNPATGGDIFPTPGGIDHGYSMRLTGSPAAGDEFSTEYNTDGVGDNRNALLFSAIANNKLMANGTTSINGSYNSLVSDVATGTKQAELNSLSRQQVLDNVRSTREANSGVNLDEEAANLVRFQQAYQAAAQLISVANNLFDTILNTVR